MRCRSVAAAPDDLILRQTQAADEEATPPSAVEAELGRYMQPLLARWLGSDLGLSRRILRSGQERAALFRRGQDSRWRNLVALLGDRVLRPLESLPIREVTAFFQLSLGRVPSGDLASMGALVCLLGARREHRSCNRYAEARTGADSTRRSATDHACGTHGPMDHGPIAIDLRAPLHRRGLCGSLLDPGRVLIHRSTDRI